MLSISESIRLSQALEKSMGQLMSRVGTSTPCTPEARIWVKVLVAILLDAELSLTPMFKTLVEWASKDKELKDWLKERI